MIETFEQFEKIANNDKSIEIDAIWKDRVKCMINGIKQVYPTISNNRAIKLGWEQFESLYLSNEENQ